jgi:VanZ family protein
MAAIFYFSAQQTVGPELPAFTRVIAHFSEYFILAWLWIWALIPVLRDRAIVAGALIAFLYALSDEFHQSFVPGRDSDPMDVLVDTLGIATASWLASKRRAAVRRRQTSH